MTSDVRVKRAAERVTLACRALSAAANDLRVAHKQTQASAVDDAAQSLEVETERVCQLAEELESFAMALSLSPQLVGASAPQH
ncbi:MAG TPA: hypothetical protein VGN08_02800 [Solirubrobacteraceae bacterium]